MCCSSCQVVWQNWAVDAGQVLMLKEHGILAGNCVMTQGNSTGWGFLGEVSWVPCAKYHLIMLHHATICCGNKLVVVHFVSWCYCFGHFLDSGQEVVRCAPLSLVLCKAIRACATPTWPFLEIVCSWCTQILTSDQSGRCNHLQDVNHKHPKLEV